MQASTLSQGGQDMSRDSMKPYQHRAVHNQQEHTPLRGSNSLSDLARPHNTPTCDGTEDVKSDDKHQPQAHQGTSRLTIKQLRQAAQEAAQLNATQNATNKSRESKTTSLPIQQKKKPSIFGGFFQVKEPTQIALNQVAAQMIAQHGSTSATKVPNVRLEKMPDHVPKVNSKWDGVPETVKQREKKEKERAKASKKDSSISSDGHSQSSDTRGNGRRPLGSRQSSTTTASFGSSERSVNSGRSRFYAQSVNSSGDLASQQRAGPSQPRRLSVHSYTASTASVPELAGDPVPDIPHYLREAMMAAEPTTDLSLRRNTDQTIRGAPVVIEELGKKEMSPGDEVANLEDLAQQSTAALAFLQNIVPPRSLPNHEAALSKNDPAQNETSAAVPLVSAAPTHAKKRPPPIITTAFLAGEAQELILPDEQVDGTTADGPSRDFQSGTRSIRTPTSATTSRVQQDLEKRPDSSRARLGLRASMLFSEEDTPWEISGQDMQALPSPQTPMTPTTPMSPHPFSSPRTKFPKSFNRFTKEKEKP